MMRKIKATRPVMPDRGHYISEITSIWETGSMTNNGPKVKRFTEMLQEYTGCANIDLFVNGHSALLAALSVLDLQGEVITSPFTFVSTTNAIIQNGLTPVFGDIDDSYNLNPDKIENLITPATCAIVTPHIFGIPCDIEKIQRIADHYGLKVIYDGAQAFGTKIQGKAIANFGDVTMFSFHAIKVFNSIEGGMLSYNDPDLHRKLDLFRNFGISYADTGSDVELVGMNAKMNEFQAAMGIVNLPEIEMEIAKREKLAAQYKMELSRIPGIQIYNYDDKVRYNYAYFPIKVTEEYGISRDELWIKLKENGIETRKLYDKLTCDFNCYKNRGYLRDTGHADKIKRQALDLPMYGELSADDIGYICKMIRQLRG